MRKDMEIFYYVTVVICVSRNVNSQGISGTATGGGQYIPPRGTQVGAPARARGTVQSNQFQSNQVQPGGQAIDPSLRCDMSCVPSAMDACNAEFVVWVEARRVGFPGFGLLAHPSWKGQNYIIVGIEEVIKDSRQFQWARRNNPSEMLVATPVGPCAPVLALGEHYLLHGTMRKIMHGPPINRVEYRPTVTTCQTQRWDTLVGELQNFYHDMRSQHNGRCPHIHEIAHLSWNPQVNTGWQSGTGWRGGTGFSTQGWSGGVPSGVGGSVGTRTAGSGGTGWGAGTRSGSGRRAGAGRTRGTARPAGSRSRTVTGVTRTAGRNRQAAVGNQVAGK